MFMRNKEIGRSILALAILGCLIAFSSLSLSAGQRGQRAGKGMPKYDPATEVTVSGVVEGTQEHISPKGWKGTHLTLKTEAETVDVHLGPSSFLEERGFQVEKGEPIEILASRVEYQGAPALNAREVKRGGSTLVLRDAQGRPSWSKGAKAPGRKRPRRP